MSIIMATVMKNNPLSYCTMHNTYSLYWQTASRGFHSMIVPVYIQVMCVHASDIDIIPGCM